MRWWCWTLLLVLVASVAMAEDGNPIKATSHAQIQCTMCSSCQNPCNPPSSPPPPPPPSPTTNNCPPPPSPPNSAGGGSYYSPPPPSQYTYSSPPPPASSGGGIYYYPPPSGGNYPRPPPPNPIVPYFPFYFYGPPHPDVGGGAPLASAAFWLVSALGLSSLVELWV